MVFLLLILYFRLEVRMKGHDFYKLNLSYVKKILNIGVPAAGEHLSYSTSLIVITVFITLLGATALATRVYTQNLTIFISMIPMAIAKGMQIYVGQLIGAGKLKEAYHQMFRGLKFCLVLVCIMALTFSFVGKSLLRLFTDDLDIIVVGSVLISIGILIEPGRAINNVTISALRATGDAKFPAIMGIISMISVPLSYLLGIYLGFGLIGIWIAMAVDEWFRGILMILRWRSRKWEEKILVDATHRK